MKSYVLVRNEKRPSSCTLYIIDDVPEAGRRTVPQCIGNEPSGSTVSTTEMVATSMLLDYFAGEADAECKAWLLRRALGRKLSQIGAKKLREYGTKNWTLTEGELSEMVADILVEAKSVQTAAQQYAEEVIVLEAIGQRRNTVRAPLSEAVPRRLPAKKRRRLTEAERLEATRRRIRFYLRGED